MEFENKKQSATNLMQSYLIEWSKKAETRLMESWENLTPCFLCERDYGDVTTLQDLLKKGADVKELEISGFACIPHVFWSKAMIGFFLEQGCSVNAQDEEGSTGLHHAVHCMWENYMEKFNNREAIQFLLENGADPNIPDNKGRIPIFYLSYTFLLYKQPRSRNIFQMLLDYGTNVEAKDQTNGESVLKLAVEILSDDKLFQKFLNDFKGNVDIRSQFEKTPFMVAVANENYGIAQLLLDRGADVNARDADGYTALHQAVSRNNNNRCDFLMKNNADPYIRSNSGRDVYELACLTWSNELFTKGATPYKLLQIYQMKGAVLILRDRSKYPNGMGLDQWKSVLDICSKYNMKPSLELVSNYELVETYRYQKNEKLKLILYRAAIRTIDRISTGSNGLWNVLYAVQKDGRSEEKFVEILSFISDKVMSFNAAGEDFASTTEEIDVLSLAYLIDTFYRNRKYSSNVGLILNCARLAVPCLSKWIPFPKDGGERRYDSFRLYTHQMCVILTRIHCSSNLDKSESLTEEIKDYLNVLVKLDDYFEGSLLHTACLPWDRRLVEVLVDFGINVQSLDKNNKTPIQLISSDIFKDDRNLRVIKKMIDKGSPVNVTNVEGKLIKDLLEKRNILQQILSKII